MKYPPQKTHMLKAKSLAGGTVFGGAENFKR
jgi:hypothetical protein